MLWVPLNRGMSAAHCLGNVREFQSVWRVVTLLLENLACRWFHAHIHWPGCGKLISQSKRIYVAPFVHLFSVINAWVGAHCSRHQLNVAFVCSFLDRVSVVKQTDYMPTEQVLRRTTHLIDGVLILQCFCIQPGTLNYGWRFKLLLCTVSVSCTQCTLMTVTGSGPKDRALCFTACNFRSIGHVGTKIWHKSTLFYS